jgi:hypothetical protein
MAGEKGQGGVTEVTLRTDESGFVGVRRGKPRLSAYAVTARAFRMSDTADKAASTSASVL